MSALPAELLSQRLSSDEVEVALRKELVRRPELLAEVAERRRIDRGIAADLREWPVDQEGSAAAIAAAMAAAVAPKHVFWRQPAVWAVAVALLAIGAIFGLRGFLPGGGFEGRDAVEQLLAIVARQDGSELQPVEAKVATLGDWLFLNHGLERYDLPALFAGDRAEGCRVVRLSGQPVVQVAIARDELLVHVMSARPLGIDVPEDGRWLFAEEAGWAAALRQHGDRAVVVARLGGTDALREILARREKETPAAPAATVPPEQGPPAGDVGP